MKRVELKNSIIKSLQAALSGGPNASSGTNETYLVSLNKEVAHWFLYIFEKPISELEESIKESLESVLEDGPDISIKEKNIYLVPLDKEGIRHLLLLTQCV